MSPSLRDMHTGDITAAAQLWYEGWFDGHLGNVPKALVELRTLESMTGRFPPLVPDTRIAELDGKLAGFCIIKNDQIYQMYAAPFARGTGVAARLMTDGEARIKAGGYSTATLDCAVGNSRAARFYEKCGWTNAGEMETAVDTSEGPFTLTLWRFEKAL